MIPSQPAIHPVYEALLGEWEAELEETEQAIFQALKEAFPQGRTRRELIKDVFDIEVLETEDLNNNRYDRKIRKTIEQMRDHLIPIVSSSSAAGYRLDISEASIAQMIEEWRRRREKYTERIERGNRLILRIRAAGPLAMPTRLSNKPTQYRMFGN